jgi:long-subunit fatty acid transport protein
MLVCSGPCVFSQTDHYWAQQYGAQGTLMGGAMIGGVRDNSAIYYNPGAFPFIKYPSLSVNANLYKIDKIFIDDGAGDGVNLNSAQVSIFPQIVSGMTNLKKLPRFQFAYCLMTRSYDNILMNARYTNDDFSFNTPDVDAYIGVFDYANQLNEQWFGIGIGYRVNDHLGVGLSAFGVYRSQTNKLSNIFREISGIDSAYSIFTLNVSEVAKYRVAEGLFKLGIAYETGRWKMGITLTTPEFRVYGRGDIEREIAIYAIAGSVQDTSQSFIISDKATSTKAYYRHPWTLGVGIEFTTPKTRIAFSAEYFFRIRPYTLMNPPADPFIYPPNMVDSGFIQDIVKSFLRVENEAGAVLNLGVGIEQQLWKKISLIAGFHTDFSSYREPPAGDQFLHSSGSWNLYHISAGLSYKMNKQIITAGINYAFSPEVNIDPFTSINPFSGFTGKAKVFPQTFAFILGYTYLFPRE